MQYRMIDIKTNYAKDEAMGSLSVLESCRDIPFDIRRLYYIQGTKAGIRRGHHAHKALWQLLICPSGSIKVNMDDGENKEHVILDDASKGLLMAPGIWHTMDWIEDDSLLCVVASDYYDESDYMRNYDEFLTFMSQHPELK